MAYEMTDAERGAIDAGVNARLDANRGTPARLMQMATDATSFLSKSNEVLSQAGGALDTVIDLGSKFGNLGTGIISRIKSWLPSGKTKQELAALQGEVRGMAGDLHALSVTQGELVELQKIAWRTLEQLNERNLLTAEALITVKNNLNLLAVDQQDMKDAIASMANRVADRFEKLENRVSSVESSQNLMAWLLNLPFEGYARYPTAIRFLKVVKDFYERKHDNYSMDEIKFLRRALKSVGLDYKSKITLGTLLDTLVLELQTFDAREYLDITEVTLSDGKKAQGSELANLLAIPSFVTICQLPESKRRLAPAIKVVVSKYGVPYVDALKDALKEDIATLYGIDLTKEVTLFDLGVELLSCYSAVPTLYEQNGTYSTTIADAADDTPRFCPECGAKLDGESSFCPACGAQV